MLRTHSAGPSGAQDRKNGVNHAKHFPVSVRSVEGGNEKNN